MIAVMFSLFIVIISNSLYGILSYSHNHSYIYISYIGKVGKSPTITPTPVTPTPGGVPETFDDILDLMFQVIEVTLMISLSL